MRSSFQMTGNWRLDAGSVSSWNRKHVFELLFQGTELARVAHYRCYQYIIAIYYVAFNDKCEDDFIGESYMFSTLNLGPTIVPS